jgi:hypothetical protein
VLEQESIARRRTASQHVQAMRKQVTQERARLVKLQQAINILRQQEQVQDPPPEQLARQLHYHQQLPQ